MREILSLAAMPCRSTTRARASARHSPARSELADLAGKPALTVPDRGPPVVKRRMRKGTCFRLTPLSPETFSLQRPTIWGDAGSRSRSKTGLSRRGSSGGAYDAKEQIGSADESFLVSRGELHGHLALCDGGRGRTDRPHADRHQRPQV